MRGMWEGISAASRGAEILFGWVSIEGVSGVKTERPSGMVEGAGCDDGSGRTVGDNAVLRDVRVRCR
jgi:hypothetical protein